MRNRITWKGFNSWLETKNNNTKVVRNNCRKCPIAVYVNQVFGVNSAYAYCAGIDCERGSRFVKVTRPGIFGQFVRKFDAVTKNNKKPSNITTAREVVKQINKENNIV